MTTQNPRLTLIEALKQYHTGNLDYRLDFNAFDVNANVKKGTDATAAQIQTIELLIECLTDDIAIEERMATMASLFGYDMCTVQLERFFETCVKRINGDRTYRGSDKPMFPSLRDVHLDELNPNDPRFDVSDCKIKPDITDILGGMKLCFNEEGRFGRYFTIHFVPGKGRYVPDRWNIYPTAYNHYFNDPLRFSVAKNPLPPGPTHVGYQPCRESATLTKL